MKIPRIILIFTTLLFALHGSGVLRSFHYISDHTQASTHHSCADAQSYSPPINQAPSDQSSEQQSEQPTEQPTDTKNEHDCDICLTINSITPIQDAPQLTTLPLTPKGELFKITNQTLHYSAQRPGDKAARAPPTC